MNEFTKEQYREEMSERRANGMDIPSYKLWVDYKKAIENIFITYK
jgi:hypothetical protein|tara:strand:- start:1323 stop:1457 length:135 start_codon:yes stop_codon:yes gene_type:complete